jgi:hypothetical protein
VTTTHIAIPAQVGQPACDVKASAYAPAITI